MEITYPTEPIRFIVPFPPGGSADPLARAFGAWFSDKFGVPVVADNRPGTAIAHTLGAKAAADGYTLLLGASSGLTTNPALGIELEYDPIEDYAPVGLAAYVPQLLVVHPSVPAKSMNELIDLIAGRIQALFASVTATQPQVSAGRIRAIATGHPERLRAMPELPAIAESLPGFSNNGWYGVFAPAGTPAPIINKLNAEMKRALANAEFSKQVESTGMMPAGSTPQELREWVVSELARWTKAVRDAGIQVQGN